MTFAGFPAAAIEFYQQLELDNSRDWWAAHRAVYDDAVRGPMLALTAELEPEFGEAKLFRPHRDTRFAKDKSPYKLHQGAYVRTAEGVKASKAKAMSELAARHVSPEAANDEAPSEAPAKSESDSSASPAKASCCGPKKSCG